MADSPVDVCVHVAWQASTHTWTNTHLQDKPASTTRMTACPSQTDPLLAWWQAQLAAALRSNAKVGG